MSLLAHGIGGVRDLPVPESFFYAAAATVLVVSFALLGALWRRPLLQVREDGADASAELHPALRGARVALQALSVGLLALVLASGFFGTTSQLDNLAPTFVYVAFWLGVPLLSVLLGDVWRVLSPWRALADAAVWALERAGREPRPLLPYPEALGRYPAAGALLAFVALELAAPDPAHPPALALAAALYTYWALAGMAVYGREPWTRGGEGFAVAFSLLARLAPLSWRRGRPVPRPPLAGLARREPSPGTVLFLAVWLGSTSFDGFSRTRAWQDVLLELRTQLAASPGRVAELAATALNSAGLLAFAAAAALAYLAATEAARRLVAAPRPLAPEFALSLVPIAFAYLVAHYFSLFVVQGQFLIPLASDPLGRGWDLFGTADVQPNLALVAPTTVWYVQVGSLVVGHVAGLALAHDRAVALFADRRDALRSQYPLLALMVLYTVGGLWLLSRG